MTDWPEVGVDYEGLDGTVRTVVRVSEAGIGWRNRAAQRLELPSLPGAGMSHPHPTVVRWVTVTVPARPVRGVRAGRVVLGTSNDRIQTRERQVWCPTCQAVVHDAG